MRCFSLVSTDKYFFLQIGQANISLPGSSFSKRHKKNPNQYVKSFIHKQIKATKTNTKPEKQNRRYINHMLDKGEV